MFLNKTFYYNVFDLFCAFSLKLTPPPPLSVKLLNLNMTSWQI